MATSTLLSNPVVTVNSVDLTDQCRSAELHVAVGELESTAFGSTSRVYVSGLYENTLKLTLYMSYAAAETYATLNALVGTQTNVTVTSNTGAVSATNPKFTLTGSFLKELPHMWSLGELSVVDVEFHGGVYSAATS
jgi:hypothetical protein